MCKHYLPALAILAACVVAIGAVQGQEPTAPASELRVADDSEQVDPGCPDLEDRPLWLISVDIRARDPEQEVVLDEELPVNCWAATGRDGHAVFLSIGACCNCLPCHDLLQLARFCHPVIYFEDPELERCGVCRCVPQLCSTTQFLCDLALLPAKLIVHPPRTYMRTPTPHCCRP